MLFLSIALIARDIPVVMDFSRTVRTLRGPARLILAARPAQVGIRLHWDDFM